MEYTARITQEFKLESLWKYEFLDIETNKQDYFYHDKQIDYNPNTTGKLNLNKDKFFQSFVKDLINTEKESIGEQSLTDFEKQSIEGISKIDKKSKHLSVELEHLKHLRKIGFTCKDLSTVYKRTERTIYRWFKMEDKQLQKRGCKSKFGQEVLDLITDYNEINNTATQQEVANYISRQIGEEISQQTVSLLLKRLGITRKKLTFHYTQLNKEKAKAFNEEIRPLLLNNTPFIAIDECSFYPNQDPRFGYSLKGTRAITRKPSHKGKHYTVLFAISNQSKNGVVKCKLIKGGAKWKDFYDFLEEINPVGDKKNILLIDNARIHTAKNKRKEAGLPSIEEQMAKKNIEVRFITAYAPMLNPTELVFNLLRQQSEKQRPRNFEEMELALKKVVDLLNTKDLSEYFWHCVEYFDKKKNAKTKL